MFTVIDSSQKTDKTAEVMGEELESKHDMP